MSCVVDEEGGDGGDAVGAKEGELQGLLEGEGEFQLGEGLLDEEGVVESHGGEGLAGWVGEFAEGGTEAIDAQGADEDKVEDY